MATPVLAENIGLRIVDVLPPAQGAEGRNVSLVLELLDGRCPPVLLHVTVVVAFQRVPDPPANPPPPGLRAAAPP